MAVSAVEEAIKVEANRVYGVPARFFVAFLRNLVQDERCEQLYLVTRGHLNDRPFYFTVRFLFDVLWSFTRIKLKDVPGRYPNLVLNSSIPAESWPARSPGIEMPA